MPGVAPVFVLADIDIIKEAPLYLALSGAGDIFGKYTALADWNIGHASQENISARSLNP